MSLFNKLFSSGFALWFALSQTLLGMSAAYAQSGLIDVEPPLIEHTIVSTVEAEARQSFFATVVDDDELDSVGLYYRFEKDSTYSSIPMNRVSYSSTYIAHVPTDPTSDLNIEYYIQARDKAGNRTVRGYAFNPLVREIMLNDTAPVVSAIEPTKASSGFAGNKRTILYVVLGVITLGAIAGAASGRSNTTEPSNACPDGICTISITVGQP